VDSDDLNEISTHIAKMSEEEAVAYVASLSRNLSKLVLSLGKGEAAALFTMAAVPDRGRGLSR
jgi:hypothetical protein